MSNWPIPASYLQTGNGPGDVVVRGVDGEIPGVPVIYRQTLADAVAIQTRLSLASGWLVPGTLQGGLDVSPATPGYIHLDPGGREITGLVSGYKFSLGSSKIDIALPTPPNTGTRDDLVFLEFWFTRAANGRSINWRIRTQQGVDFTTYPDGLSDPSLFAQGANASVTTTNFQKYPSMFDLSADPGLYLAPLPGQTNDPLTEKGLDGNMYLQVFALPIARIKRYNTTTFDPVSNLNGSNSYVAGLVANRPDGEFADTFSGNQIIDLRSVLNPVENIQQLTRQTLTKKLLHQLTAQGVAQTVITQLNASGFMSSFIDGTVAPKIVVPANLVRYSHFQADTDGNGYADSWSSYSANSGTGTASVTTAGQLLGRTAGDWGVTQTLSNFYSNRFAVRVKFTPSFGDVGSNLEVVAVRGDSSIAFSCNQPLGGLTLNQAFEITKVFELETYESSLTLNVYVTGGNAQLTIDYVDVKATDRLTGVMKIDNGATATLSPSSGMTAVGASFTTAIAYAADGSSLTGTPSIVSEDLVFTFNIVPGRTDFVLVPTVNYPVGGGFSSLLSTISRAWDQDGFVAAIETGTVSKQMTANELNSPILVVNSLNETVTLDNPETSASGCFATAEIAGNGSGTYTLPATFYGRNVLLPIAVRVGGSPVQLSTTIRNSDGSIAITLGSNQTVSTGSTFEVDLLLDAPILVTASDLNGVKAIYRASYHETMLQSTATSVVIPTDGMTINSVNSDVCSAVFVNGTAVGLGVALTITASNIPGAIINFPSPQASGSRIGIVVLEQLDVPLDQVMHVVYGSPIDPTSSPTGNITLLTDPILLAHTKGSGAVDQTGDYGLQAFIKDPNLTAGAIQLSNSTGPARTVVESPVRANTLKGEPLYAGRMIAVTDLLDTTLDIEGDQLSSPVNHRVLAAMLVSWMGNRLLLVLEQARSDAHNAIDHTATATFYIPNGRPIGVA